MVIQTNSKEERIVSKVQSCKRKNFSQRKSYKRSLLDHHLRGSKKNKLFTTKTETRIFFQNDFYFNIKLSIKESITNFITR